MHFSREKLTPEFLEQLSPLMHQHWEEIAHYKAIPLAPDFERYLRIEEMGNFRAYMARDEKSGAIVGYAAFFVDYHLHYSGTKYAVQDVLFMHPEYRGGAGAELIRYSEQQLRADGVDVILHHVKFAHPAAGKMLRKEGYSPMDEILCKRLGDEK